MSPLYRITVLVFLFFVLTACSLPWPGRNLTLAQLPNLSGYRQYEGTDLADNLASNEILDMLLLGRPELAVVAEIIGQAGNCAQDQGVVNWRAYVSDADPTAAGVVIVASQKQAMNPQVLLQCGASLVSRRGLADLSPCNAAFRYTTPNDTYFVYYAASKQEVCAAFDQAIPDGE